MRVGIMGTLATAVLLTGCSETTGLGDSALEPGTARLSLSFSTTAGGSNAAPRLSVMTADTLRDGSSTLVVTQAQVVLREIELERVHVIDCDGAIDHEECEKFETGPMLVDLPLDGSAARELTIAVDTGAYDEIEFEIHKIDDDDPEDAAFRQAHPDFIGTSIRVQGSFNDQPFTFETDLNVEQELRLVPPLVVDALTTDVNVTVRIDLSGWFVDSAGSLVDPSSANKGGVNRNLVEGNIERSIEAFNDDDHDGHDDHR